MFRLTAAKGVFDQQSRWFFYRVLILLSEYITHKQVVGCIPSLWRSSWLPLAQKPTAKHTHPASLAYWTTTTFDLGVCTCGSGCACYGGRSSECGSGLSRNRPCLQSNATLRVAIVNPFPDNRSSRSTRSRGGRMRRSEAPPPSQPLR